VFTLFFAPFIFLLYFRYLSVYFACGKKLFFGGPQVPDLMGVLMKMLKVGGLGFLMKKAVNLFKKLKCKKFKGCKY